MSLTHNRRTKDLPHPTGRIHLLWLRIFLVMILITSGTGLFRLLFNFRAETMLLVPVCFSIMVYVAGYMALNILKP